MTRGLFILIVIAVILGSWCGDQDEYNDNYDDPEPYYYSRPGG